jgi:hypothetical protein
MTKSQVSFTHSPWPDCTVELISYVDDAPEYPGPHGSGFFVQREEQVYLVTAGHCLVPKVGNAQDFLEKANDVVARLMIPIERPTGRTRLQAEDYIEFMSIGYAIIENSSGDFFGSEDEGNLDVAVLQLNPTHAGRVRERSVKLPPTGEWFIRSMRIAAKMQANVPLQVSGFPREGTGSSVDYDEMRIVSQGVHLIGDYCGQGPYPHTHTLTIRQGATRYDPNGMSGGPIYMRTRNGNAPPYALVGMALRGGHGTDTVHFCTVDWLTVAIDKARQS